MLILPRDVATLRPAALGKNVRVPFTVNTGVLPFPQNRLPKESVFDW